MKFLFFLMIIMYSISVSAISATKKDPTFHEAYFSSIENEMIRQSIRADLKIEIDKIERDYETVVDPHVYIGYNIYSNFGKHYVKCHLGLLVEEERIVINHCESASLLLPGYRADIFFFNLDLVSQAHY